MFLIQPTPDDRATDFKPVEGTTGEHYSGYTLMVEAYAAIWLILMAWLVLLWRKQADLGARLEGLEAAIDRAERRATGTAKAKTSKPPAADAEGAGAEKSA